jgi:hypothetical protein
MSLENDFHQALEEWISYCRTTQVQISSSAEPVINCDFYRRIVSMGYEALPLVRQAYDRDSSDNCGLSTVQGHGLVYVVRGIVGDDFSIPEEIQGRISAMEDHTKRWLDENMSNYVPTQ